MRALTSEELELIAGGDGTTVAPVPVIGTPPTPPWYPPTGWEAPPYSPPPPDDGGGDSGGSSSGVGSGDDPSPDPAVPLEPRQFGIGSIFLTPEAAMQDALKRLHSYTVAQNKEIKGIVQTTSDGKFYVDRLWIGDIDGVGKVTFTGSPVAISFHTHGAYNDANHDGKDDHDADHISADDKVGAQADGHDEYVLTPGGTILKYDVETDAVSTYANVNDPYPAPVEGPPPGPGPGF